MRFEWVSIFSSIPLMFLTRIPPHRLRDDARRANAFFGWSQHCDAKGLVVESATASEVMRFDAPSRWSEIKRGGEIESSPSLRFRVVSSNAFGGWFDDPKNQLRLHVRDSKQASHWVWVGGAQRVDRSNRPAVDPCHGTAG